MSCTCTSKLLKKEEEEEEEEDEEEEEKISAVWEKDEGEDCKEQKDLHRDSLLNKSLIGFTNEQHANDEGS
uniref:Uncharacterized protein n=1 Tax=Vespula pensylvanica TaxID=30213 RepID=A0A834KEG6_VESPE|nr:hypothetical protein H0235_015106 [Vespula pensylvanica]